MTSSAATLQNVGIRYGDVVAVQDASFQVCGGEVHALLGQSGAGKTSLLRAIAGFERISTGQLRVANTEVDGAAWVPPERRNVGVVFQDYALFPHLSVAKNIAFGMPPGAPVAERVDRLLALVGLPNMGSRRPNQLSGGEQQRVALARALAQEPAVLLLDEPFAHLDPSRRDSLRDETMRVVRESGVAAVLVTHDAQDAMIAADVVHIMHNGRIHQSGTPQTLYTEPQSREVATALGSANFIEPGSPATDALGLTGRELPGAGATVMIRPEWLTIGAEGVPAEVIRVRFEGPAQRATVVVGGETLQCLAPSAPEMRLGEAKVSVGRAWRIAAP